MLRMRFNLLDVPLEIIDEDHVGAVLLGTSYVSGEGPGTSVGIHVDLIAVKTDENGMQQAVDICREADYERALEICGDGPLGTIRITGMPYDYIVLAYPFAQ